MALEGVLIFQNTKQPPKMATFRKFAFPDGATADKVLGEFLQPLTTP